MMSSTPSPKATSFGSRTASLFPLLKVRLRATVIVSIPLDIRVYTFYDLTVKPASTFPFTKPAPSSGVNATYGSQSVRASLGCAGLAAPGLAAASLNTSDLVLHNPSASLEPVFYVSADLEVERGAVVTIPVGAVDLAYAEDGLVKASGARFLKRVAAIEGDRVCSGNGRIT